MSTKSPTPDGILALHRAWKILGKQDVLAAVVGVTQPSVHYMLKGGKRVPAE
jgi:DNA-binding transcriptional regulator YdaS (Cro superfamily)